MRGILPYRQAVDVDLSAELFEGRDFALGVESRVQSVLCYASIFEGSFSSLVWCDDISAT